MTNHGALHLFEEKAVARQLRDEQQMFPYFPTVFEQLIAVDIFLQHINTASILYFSETLSPIVNGVELQNIDKLKVNNSIYGRGEKTIRKAIPA